MGQHAEDRPRRRPSAVRPGRVRAKAPSGRDRLLELQRQAGNAAVTGLLTGPATVQRAGGDEIRVELVVDRLQGAIKHDSETRGDVSTSFVTIDVEKAAAALDGLTPAQGKAVQTVWLARDGRPLKELIAGTAPGRGNQTYLDTDKRRRLLGLLDGTVYEPTGPPADPWDPDAGRRVVEERTLLVDVAHLHAALPDRKARDAVFDILARRGGAPGSAKFVALNDEYKRQWNTGLYVDIARYLRDTDNARAEALLEGRTDAATGMELESLGDLKVYSTATPKERVYAEQIEARLEQLRQESGGDPDKIKQVLAQAATQGTRTVGQAIVRGSDDATKRVIDALVSGSDAAVIAARLARLESEKRITGTDVERALVELRTKAVMADTLDLAKNPPPVPLTQAQRAKREQDAIAGVFKAFGEAWFGYTGRGFEMLVLFTGTEVERERNRELLRGMGAYVPDANPFADPATHRTAGYIELDLAVRSWDSGRIKAALSGRSKAQIDKLAAEFEKHHGKPLWSWLHLMLMMTIKPTSVTPKLNKEEVEELIQFLQHGAVFSPRAGGDRFDNLVAEGAWYWQRIETLYDRTMANRGLFAELRDWKGNLEHELVAKAFRRAKQANDAIAQAARIKSMKSGGEIAEHVTDLKASFNRLRYNVDVYTDATRAAFLSFVELAVNLVSIAVSFTTGGAGAMVVRGIVGTVGTKLILLQEEYSAGEFVKDVLGQVGGALGGQAATAMLQRGIGPLSQAARAAGLRMSPEIAGLAGKGLEWAAEQVGSTAGTQIATGQTVALPTLKEWTDAAALTLAHKGKAAVARPKGARGRAGLPANAPKTTITERPEQGVRRVAELPSGTKLKILENGRVALCHSPCQVDDTLASLLERDFERELGHRSDDAKALKEAVAELRRRETASIAAGDDAAREAQFAESITLTGRLERLRIGLIAERRGMSHDDVTVLMEAVEGDHRLLEQFLGYARNDIERVTEVLAYARRDRPTLERLRDMAKDMKDREDPGQRFEHESLRPWALAANMRHFLDAHTSRYFDLATRTAALTGFWPVGTTRAHVEAYLVEAFQKMAADPGLQPAPGERRWEKTVLLDNGIRVQIGVTDRYVGQFYPVQDTTGAGRVDSFALTELRMIGRLLFGRR
jgi:hypothetical protein